MNAILNIGILVASVIPLTFNRKPPDPLKQTSITIDVGSGGSTPHVAFWGEGGDRIAQYGGNANYHICSGETWQTTVDNKQNGMHPEIPTYVSVVMNEGDAICVTHIIVSGNNQEWTWSADMGYTCGAQWMESTLTWRGSNVPLRCVWLDQDHTNNIVAKGLSLHIRDFTADAGLVAQYGNNTDRLCKNSARMTFQPEPFVPNAIPRFFSPPLEYTRNENEDDPSKPSTAGALTHPDQGIDRKTNAYPDGTDMNIGKNHKRHALNFKRSTLVGVTNIKPGVLVVSHFPQHSAKEMCEHPTSLGPDFVSVVEKIYCDMETAKWWPLCDAEHTKECFDLDTQRIKVDGPAKRDDTPLKQYTKHEEWGLTHEKRALLPRIKKRPKPGDRCNPKE